MVIFIFLLFHIAFPLLIFELPYIKKNFEVNRFALLIGALIPDIIDKSLMFLGLGSGRGYSHTLLFVFTAFFILFLTTKGNKSIAVPFLIGELIHLILDLPYVPLFYPFISYEFIIVEAPLNLWLETLLTDPIIITTEIAGAIILIFIVINNKLYSISQIIDYLKTSRME
ncbi:MAG: metal-dependent hydrolase [Promethearchaeota archaeon]